MIVSRIALLVGVFALCGCGSRSDESLRQDAPKVVDTGKSKETAFEDAACFECANTACADAITRCEADPGCAGFENCLWACPITSSGVPTTQCASQCTVADNAETETRVSALRSCVERVDCTACNAEPAVVDAGPPPNGDPSCTPTRPDNECNVCSWSKCCDVRTQCKGEPECDSFFDCLDACELPTVKQCRQECGQKLPNGRWPFDHLLQCVDVRCSTECESLHETCLDCGRSFCGETLLTCLADKACWEIFSCSADNCGVGSDPDCIPECAERSPTGVGAYNDFLECGLLNCEAECAG